MDFAFDDTWRAFRGADRTLGPTSTALADWHQGRRRYAVWALRISSGVVRSRMQLVADALGDAVVPVAPTDAHVTIWISGFPCVRPERNDDVPETALAAQQRAARDLAPPRLLAGAPNAFASCAFLEVHDPRGDLGKLRRALAVPGAPDLSFARYQPHITVGRFADSRAGGPVAAALERLRASGDFDAHPLREASLELLELDAHAPDRLRWRQRP